MKKFIITTLALVSIQAAAIGECNYQQLQAEANSLKSSPYWSQLFKSLAADLNTVRPRGCGEMSNEPTVGLEMFMDDLEFTAPRSSERVLAYTGEYQTDWKSDSDYISFSTTDSNLFRPNVIEVRLGLLQGHMSLYAKTCSPKVALAHLIAYAP
ncbi:MAG: hypothetical protein ACAH59_05115, partial [Pseudobdellovibrionaceae bacterium]